MLAFLYPDRFTDPSSAWPARALTYGHALREALSSSPAAPLPRAAALPLTLAALASIAHASYRRGARAGELELRPDALRPAVYGATLDSAVTLWLECVTLPSLLQAALARATGRAFAAAAPRAPLVARAGPAALAVAMLPLCTLPVSAHVGDALMEWAFRPAMGYFAGAAAAGRGGGGDMAGGGYVPPIPEDLRVGGDQGAAGLMALLPPDFDELDRRRLQWALDGSEESVYPELAARAAGVGRPPPRVQQK